MDDQRAAAGDGERRAFLSFSHKDHRLGARVLRGVRHYRVPTALREAHGASLRVTARDRAEVMAGGELSERLKGALADSDALIVLCSPRAASSRWVNQEIAAFKLMGKGARIIPVITAGAPAEALPLTLRFEVDSDGGPTDRPDETVRASVDLRRGGEGWATGRLKIIAAALGADIEALRSSEQTRGMWRLAFAALALAGGAAVYALVFAG